MGTGTGAGTGRERGRGRGRGRRPVDEHRIGTGTGTGTKARTVAEMESGTRMGTGTRIGSGRVEGRQISTRKRIIVVDAMWEKGETWVKGGKNVEKKALVQYLPTQIISRIRRKQGGEYKALRA